ncbi:MAG TPA: hypothetical protein VK116_11150 [Planctomycetota bacterium]|nr:hypothetical protein [Planctomycetota bacterium]
MGNRRGLHATALGTCDKDAGMPSRKKELETLGALLSSSPSAESIASILDVRRESVYEVLDSLRAKGPKRRGRYRSHVVRGIVRRAVGIDASPSDRRGGRAVTAAFAGLEDAYRRIVATKNLAPADIEIARWHARMVHAPHLPHEGYAGPPITMRNLSGMIGLSSPRPAYEAALSLISQDPEQYREDPLLRHFVARICFWGQLRLSNVPGATRAVGVVEDMTDLAAHPPGDAFLVMQFHSALHGANGLSREFIERIESRPYIREVALFSARHFELPDVRALARATSVWLDTFYWKAPHVRRVVEILLPGMPEL